MLTPKAELWLEDNIKSLTGYLAQGFDIYVFVDAETNNVDFSVFTGNTIWNHRCPLTLTHVIRGFEGGHPEMVHTLEHLLTYEEQDELKSLGEDVSLDDYIEDKDINIDARQIELWVDEFNPKDWEV